MLTLFLCFIQQAPLLFTCNRFNGWTVSFYWIGAIAAWKNNCNWAKKQVLISRNRRKNNFLMLEQHIPVLIIDR